MEPNERKIKSFRFKADEVSEEGVFSGYASTFNETDLGGDMVMPGAFDNWLREWKSGVVVTPPILYNHDADKLLGIYLDFVPDTKGLWVKGQLNQEIVDGKEKRALMRQGAITGLSIGFSTYPGGYKWDEEKRVYILTDINLWEVSLATFPMNTSARIDAVKANSAIGEGRTIRDIERSFRALGYSATDAKIIAKAASERLGRSGDHREGDSKTSESVEVINNLLRPKMR